LSSQLKFVGDFRSSYIFNKSSYLKVEVNRTDCTLQLVFSGFRFSDVIATAPPELRAGFFVSHLGFFDVQQSLSSETMSQFLLNFFYFVADGGVK
jgi:hypothetical protein